jgi:N-acetylglucosamine-6-sulfatase
VRARRALAPAFLAVGCGGGALPPSAPPPPPSPPKPSIVLILTDDLDVRSTEILPRLPALMSDPGLSFPRYYVTHSLCAPSRASILTGQYTHNHRVIYNLGPEGGFQSFYRSGREASTVATWLKAAGYRTALVGKYLNDYATGASESYIPPGWDEWQADLTADLDLRYYNYSLNENGTVVSYGQRPEDYSTDVFAAKAVDFIRRAAADEKTPFFLYLAPHAPHKPAVYADRHAHEFQGGGAFRVPSFNEDDVHEKPAFVQNVAHLNARDIQLLDEFQVSRLRSMRAVEEMVDQVLQALIATGRIGKTYVFFTSDNGLEMGEHRLVGRKNVNYEEAIRVPLIVRGPGVPPGRSLPHAVLNIDLAPTFAELAGAKVPDFVDGRSFVPLLGASPPDPGTWRQDFLVEYYDADVSAGLRTEKYLYNFLESYEIELYDMQADPYQLHNLRRHVDPGFMDPFALRLSDLLACHAASCRP